MSRPQDSIIDDDEESCPLCIEEFDLTDKNFKPCPCGYQICQFCFNSLKNTYEKSTCPNCRRVYDEKTIQFKIPSKEDIVLDKENKARKQAATKRKEGEKREVETSNRRNLAGVRVKQQNLVYVIGLVPLVKDEGTLLQTLRGPQYFGQYGDIDKIVVSKSKPGSSTHGVGVYITYATKDAAALCIEAVDGSMNGDRVLRAQYGTTKYCSAYLRGDVCSNKSCTFLHETGEDGHGVTLQNETSRPKIVARSSYNNQTLHTQANTRSQPQSSSPLVASQPMHQESSKENAKGRLNITDASALPSTASWANRGATGSSNSKATSASQTTAKPPASSPNVANATLSEKKPDHSALFANSSHHGQEQKGPSAPSKADTTAEKRPEPTMLNTQQALLKRLISNINSPSFRFSFDEKAFTKDELAAIIRCPTMIDPYGGVKRRLMREKEAERLKQQLEAQTKLQGGSSSTNIRQEENAEEGSLGFRDGPEGSHKFATGEGIHKPLELSSAVDGLGDHMLDVENSSSNLDALQRRQLALLNSSGIAAAASLGRLGGSGTGLGSFQEQPPSAFQTQMSDPLQGHTRQSSRYSFANDSVKPNPTPRLPAVQQQASQSSQPLYTSGVQGPPPGLKTAGTPPVSGGGMFAQGHGFTSNMSAGFGSSKEPNAEIQIRGRSATGSGHDASKRSGVADLADPSILQARLHQHNGGIGQGLLGGQNQVDQEFPPLKAPTQTGGTTRTSSLDIDVVQRSTAAPDRSLTPKMPPGLSLPHAHPFPTTDDRDDGSKTTSLMPITSASLAPALPRTFIGQKSESTKMDREKLAGTDQTAESFLQSDQKDYLARLDDDALDVTKLNLTGGSIQDDRVINKNRAEPYADIKRAQPERAKGPEENNDAIAITLTDERAARKLDKLNIPAAMAGATPDPDSTHGDQIPVPDSVASMPTPPAETLPSDPMSSTISPERTNRPRTLRLTAVASTKSEMTPSSATTERSGKLSAGILRQASRQPSSSPAPLSQPSTPTVSDHGTSAAVSRVSSPHVADRSGTTGEKKKPKGGTKEKKSKSDMPTAELRDAKSASSTPPLAEEVGPIVCRQRKKKKTIEKIGTRASETKDSSEVKANSIRARGQGKVLTEKHDDEDERHSSSTYRKTFNSEPERVGLALETVAEPGLKHSATGPQVCATRASMNAEPRKSYTLNDLLDEASQMSDPEASILELMNSSISPTSTLLGGALKSNELNLDGALFGAPPLASYRLPHDPRRGADYLESNGYSTSCPFGEIYLSQQDRRQLVQGGEVRRSDANRPQNLLKRNLITSTGSIYRHLSAPEEDEVLKLEGRLRSHEETYGITAKFETMPGDSLDFMNLTGGLQELTSFPALHRVGVLISDSQMGHAEAKAAADERQQGGDGNDHRSGTDGPDAATDHQLAPLANDFGMATSAPTTPEMTMNKPISPSTMKRKADALMSVNLRNMDVDKLQRRIRETQVEVEGARKEAEGLEKRTARKAKDVVKWREALLRDIGTV